MSWARFVLCVAAFYLICVTILNADPARVDRLVADLLSRLPRDRQDALVAKWRHAFNRRSGSHSRFRFSLACLIECAWATMCDAARLRHARLKAWTRGFVLGLIETLSRVGRGVGGIRLPSILPPIGFRGAGWVVTCAIVSPACYLVTAQASVERSKLAIIEKEIAKARTQVRNLSTEFAFRSNFLQLQKWSEDLGYVSVAQERVCPDSKCAFAVFDRDVQEKAASGKGKAARPTVRDVPKGS